MPSSNELTGFVKEALTQGLPRAQIEDILAKAGWSAAEIRDVLGAFAEVPFPIPVPRPRPSLEAREVFLYLMLFGSMYLSAYNFGSLIFEFIERALPEIGQKATPLGEAIRWPVSFLIVALPVFIYTTWLVNRDIRLDPGKRLSEVRRKLTYLTLFFSACVITGVLTYLIYSFLGGELTLRFVLKTLTVGAIAGTVFGYYLRDMRLDVIKTKA